MSFVLLDSCTVANAIETFDVRLRNEGFSESYLCCRFPKLPPMVGYATTLRVRTSSPPWKGKGYSDPTDWWRHLEDIPVPHVVVIQDIDISPRKRCFYRGRSCKHFQSTRLRGSCPNGAVRDLAAIEALNFQLFSEKVSVFHAYVHIVEFGMPVEVAGLRVRLGDLLNGDQNGLVRIPLEIAKDIPEIATSLREREEQIIAYCQSGGFSVAGLDGFRTG